METNEKNNWDKANKQDQNLTGNSNHRDDERHQNRHADGRERQSDEYNDTDDVAENRFSESDDSYGHGKEYYSRNYTPGGRSSRDDIPMNDSGA